MGAAGLLCTALDAGTRQGKCRGLYVRNVPSHKPDPALCAREIPEPPPTLHFLLLTALPAPGRYLTGRTTGGIWLCFFAAQAPLVVAERAALAALKLRGIRVPTLLRRVVTLLLLVYAGQLLFWPPAMEHGVVSSLIANTQAGILQLTTAMRAVLPPR